MGTADFAPLRGAALQVAHMQTGRNISVLLPMPTGLTAWLFGIGNYGPSLGKQGHGSVPVNALGPVDQHSQAQLYGWAGR